MKSDKGFKKGHQKNKFYSSRRGVQHMQNGPMKFKLLSYFLRSQPLVKKYIQDHSLKENFNWEDELDEEIKVTPSPEDSTLI